MSFRFFCRAYFYDCGRLAFLPQDCVPSVPSCWNWWGKIGAHPLASVARMGQEQTMIAKLSGRLDETGDDWAIVDVQGVGYLVHCSTKTLTALGEVGEACTVHTDLQVSENDMRLLGFAESAERDWFRLLTTVQGVGSKVALAILSALSFGELRDACAGGDAAMVARAQGVGPKLAGRIVNELKDKAGALPGGGLAGVAVGGGGMPAGGASADAVSALENLGFKPAVAAQAVARAQGELGEDASESDLIRVALKRAAG
ncbi:DNA helicase [Altererythrobacter insulae]|nr:DNA helicase [Altererythrobacter insulae]